MSQRHSMLALLLASATLPALLRWMAPDAPLRLALLFALAMGLLAQTLHVPLPWGRWLRETLRACAVVLLLAALHSSRRIEGPSTTTFAPIGRLLLAAAVEEFVYRGLLPAALPSRAACTLSSLAFGAAHPAALAGHVVAGALFFALRGADGSLVAPMIAHFAYNGAVIMAME